MITLYVHRKVQIETSTLIFRIMWLKRVSVLKARLHFIGNCSFISIIVCTHKLCTYIYILYTCNIYTIYMLFINMHTHNFTDEFLVLGMVITVQHRQVWNVQESPASAPPVLGSQVHTPECLAAFCI